ncbi:hypothetical protein B0H14DRAFT_2632643 [Mycena olivaceomarginata]|nr:hypothetical protein B0H14DRAFT_2632643 [Mycena olivaceomarginata]
MPMPVDDDMSRHIGYMHASNVETEFTEKTRRGEQEQRQPLTELQVAEEGLASAQSVDAALARGCVTHTWDLLQHRCRGAVVRMLRQAGRLWWSLYARRVPLVYYPVTQTVPVGDRLHTVSGVHRITSDSEDTWRAWEGNMERTGGKKQMALSSPKVVMCLGKGRKDSWLSTMSVLKFPLKNFATNTSAAHIQSTSRSIRQWRNKHTFEFRYSTCTPGLLPSTATMSPSTLKLRLMLCVSFSCSPLAPPATLAPSPCPSVASRSLLTRCTRFSVPTHTPSPPLAPSCTPRMRSVNTECERDERSMSVAAMALRLREEARTCAGEVCGEVVVDLVLASRNRITARLVAIRLLFACSSSCTSPGHYSVACPAQATNANSNANSNSSKVSFNQLDLNRVVHVLIYSNPRLSILPFLPFPCSSPVRVLVNPKRTRNGRPASYFPEILPYSKLVSTVKMRNILFPELAGSRNSHSEDLWFGRVVHARMPPSKTLTRWRSGHYILHDSLKFESVESDPNYLAPVRTSQFIKCSRPGPSLPSSRRSRPDVDDICPKRSGPHLLHMARIVKIALREK